MLGAEIAPFFWSIFRNMTLSWSIFELFGLFIGAIDAKFSVDFESKVYFEFRVKNESENLAYF